MVVSPAPDVRCKSLDLLQQYAENASTELRNRLVRLNLGLVRREAHRFDRQTHESFEDLVQVGSIGLIRAIERFDTKKGYAFSSFAIPYIRGEIQHYLRDKSPQVKIPRRWQTLQTQAVRLTREVHEQQNRYPTDAEFSQSLDISMDEWQEVKLSVYNRSLISLDAPVKQGEEDCGSLGDLLPDRHYRSFHLAQEDKIRIQQCLSKLEQRTRQVLEFVFLYDLTQKEAAEVLGISAVTVSRQVKKGITTMQQLMVNAEEEAALEAETIH
ncbi:RNA polymerase sigma factor SigF [Lyngbya confervoides]|uniref:RNA polymerase sigma factor SigF n=1 Tax=Lyngbya confervoides BDU141951 TaxID=1574623 RepID=A0ABD4SYV2_9CYAN|nr:RNA polymerase sigma factor SigF [Lyngbya confervoides]MCM1981326.1 RNA polymerase sigma factor SigF [Lyngbya confervoides BDU141951]